MKKILAALLLLSLFAGTALADHDKHRDYDDKRCGDRYYKEYCSDLYSDFKEEYEELRELISELREEMSEDKPDKKKAKKLYKEITELRGELRKKGFDRRMDYYEECRENGHFRGEHRGHGSYGRHGGYRGYHCPGTIVIDTVSEEEREEIAKLYKKLRKERSKASPDREKIRELYEEIAEKHEKYRRKAFEELLEHPEKYRGTGYPCSGPFNIKIEIDD